MAGVQFQGSLTLGSPSTRDLKPPPARSLLELARCDQALGSRKYQGPGRAGPSTPDLTEAPPSKFSAVPYSLSVPMCPPYYTRPSSFRSGLSVSPVGPRVSLARSGPSSVPPASQSHFACQRRARKTAGTAKNPVCAMTPQTSLYFYCSVNYCLNFNKSLRQEGGPAVSFSVQTRAGSDSGVI